MHSHQRNPAWLSTARKLHALKTQAGEACNCRPTLNPVALKPKLAAVEQCYDLTLPPSYRDFLLRYDGWHNVFRQASLLSCAQLLNPSVLHRAEVALERAGTPLPGMVSSLSTSWREDNLMPIGLDPQGGILFVLDASTARADGEMDALVWIAELGIRLASFGEIFSLLYELMECRYRARLSSAAFAA